VKKRLPGLMLALIIFASMLPVPDVSADTEEVFFADNFEEREQGDFSVANSVYDKTPIWYTIPEGGEIVKEEITGNKILKLTNRGSASATLNVQKSFTTSSDSMNFVWEFDIITNGNKTDVRLYEYGKLTVDVPISFTADGKVNSYGKTVSVYSPKSWQNVKIEGFTDDNYVRVYLNEELINERALYNNPPEPHRLRVHQMMFTLGSGRSILLDNYKITRLAAESNASEENASIEVNWLAPDKLDEYKGVHPRLLYSEDKFNELREIINEGSDPNVSKAWELIKKNADSLLDYRVPEFSNSGENLWLEDVGKNLIPLSFVYRITNEKKYFDKAYYIAVELVNLPKWTGASSADGSYNELASRGPFYGVSLFWDWCYHSMDVNQRYEMLKRMAVIGESMNGGGWWRAAYLQNHSIHGRSSAFIMGAAIYDEYPAAVGWMQNSLKNLKQTINLWPEDGVGYEGHMYSNSAMCDLVIFGSISEKLLGINVLADSIFKENTNFVMYNSLPAEDWQVGKDQFGYGDSTPQSNFIMYSYMATLAAYHKLPAAQWYALKQLDFKHKYGTPSDDADAFFLAGYDSSLKPVPPSEIPGEYPVFKHFEDTGYMYLRDGWAGKDDSITFRCGYVMGKDAAEYRERASYDLGMGHPHPDINHFLIHANGEWLFKDDGYTVGTTGNHNTVLVNGYGQKGELASGTAVTGKNTTEIVKAQNIAHPHIVKAQLEGNIAYVYADATDAYYTEEHKLEKIARHFIYIKDKRVLLLYDEFKSAEENEYQLRFRPESQQPVEQIDGSFSYEYGNTNMIIRPFANGGTVKNEKETFVYGKSGGTVDNMLLSITNKATEWSTATAISWSDKGKTPFAVEFVEDEGKKIFTVDNSEIVLDLNEYTVTENEFENERNIMVDGRLANLENPPVLRNGTIMAPVSEMLKLLGKEEAENLIMEGSSAISENGKEQSFTGKAEIINGVLYAPVRMLAAASGVGIYYEPETQIAVIDSSMEMTNAEIFKMSVNGVDAEILPDGSYSAMFFADALNIIPVTAVKGSSCTVEKCPGVFGESKVTVTSADKTVTKEYKVISRPQENIGNLPVHNVVTEYATSADMLITFDKDLSTTWPISGSGFDVTYDLGSAVNLEKVVIAYNHGDQRKQYVDIDVSVDGVSYEKVFSGPSSGTTNEGDYYEIGRKVRFVKITYNGVNGSSGWNNTREVGFIGTL